jgi:hypothetical protein
MSMMHHWRSNDHRNKGQQQNQTKKVANKNFRGLCIIGKNEERKMSEINNDNNNYE